MTAPADGAQRVWTILSLVQWAEEYMRDRGFQESRLNAELLLAHVLDLPRLGLYLQFDRHLTPGELAEFRKLFLRRMAHEPVQYILGETNFMGFRLELTPAVLIPRPETEELVEEAAAWAKNAGIAGGSILEIGTGSGNIAVALAKFLPAWRVTTLESSGEALDVARRNCQRHGVDTVEFLLGDVFTYECDGRPFDAVVSNPPYVSAEDFEALEPEVKNFEPSRATTDGGDGLAFIRRIASLSRGILRPGGGMFLEIGHGQAEAAAFIARESGLTGVEVRNDFAGIGRILLGFSPGGDRQA